MHSLLRGAGAEYGARCENHGTAYQVDEAKEAKMISDSTPTVGIASELLVTISFAAAFTIPGGYRADDAGSKSGTPVLAGSYSFEVFIVANNLALLCSTLATIFLVYAGVDYFHIRIRMTAFAVSVFFLHSSARSLAAAFAFSAHTQRWLRLLAQLLLLHGWVWLSRS